jgi:WD40 repeat protein
MWVWSRPTRIERVECYAITYAVLPRVRYFAAAAGTEQALVLGGHQDRVRSAAFSPDGTRIVTASNDRTARIWDAVLTESES